MYFTQCHTVEQIKQEYKRLCFLYHPDVSGSNTTREMQDINAAYLAALARYHGQTREGSDGKTHTYYYNEARERAAMDVIDTLIKAGFSQAVIIELLGSWVWVSGIVYKSNDHAILQTLKHPTRKRNDGNPASLLKWHSKRGRYYWSPDGSKSHYNERASFDDLRWTYGSEAFKPQDDERQERRQPAAAIAD